MLRKIINYIPGVAAPMLINFLLTMLYAGYLEPGEYGVLNIYLTTILMVYSVSLNVFQTACLRFYSLNLHKDEAEYVSSYLIANVITTVLIIPFSLIINVFLKFNWWIIVLAVGANGLFQFLCNYYRVINKAKKYNADRMLSSLGGLVLLIVFGKIINPLTYVWPLIAVYGSYMLVACFEIISIRKDFHVSAFSWQLIKESLKYGFPLIGVSILGYVVSSSDQYILLYYLGDAAVGNYSLGYRLVDALTINFLTMILLVMTPELNRQHDKHGATKSQNVLKNMMSAAMWIMLPLSFAIIVYSSDIIHFVFPAYTDAAHIMQLVILASIFHGISMFTCKGLELVKHPKFVFYGLFVAAIINVAYNFIFIPVYGIDASAHSSILAYVVYNILLVAFTKRYYKIIFDWIHLAKTCIVTAVTVCCALVMMHFFPISSIGILIIEGIVCVAIYIGLSFVLKLTDAIIK